MARNVSWILAGFMLITLLDASLAEEGKWIQKADMPTARSVPSVSVVNGIIYAIGGTPDNAAVLSTLEAYNPQTDKWTKKKDMPTARGWFSTSMVNGKIYAFGPLGKGPNIFPSAPTTAFDNSGINRAIYSKDGNFLLVPSRDGINLYNPVTLIPVGQLPSKAISVALAFSPDGKLLASSDFDSKIRLWDMAKQELIATLTENRYSNSIAFSLDGAFLVSASTMVHVWDLTKKRKVASLDTQPLVGNQPWEVLFKGNKRVVVATVNGRILVWDFEKAKIIGKMNHQASFPSIALSADGKTLLSIASTEGRGDLKFWEVETGKQIAVMRNTKTRMLTAHPNGNWVASFGWWEQKDTVIIWDITAKTEIAQFPVVGKITSLSFHPDGDRFALVTGNTTIQIWDVKAGKKITQKETHTGSARAIAMSPEGEFFAASYSDNTVRLWDIEDGKTLVRLAGHASTPQTLAFSPNGEMLASGDALTIRIWDVALRKEHFHFDHPGPQAVVFSPDGRLICAVNDLQS